MRLWTRSCHGRIGCLSPASSTSAAEKAKEMPDDFIINIDPDAFDDEMANNAEEGL